MTLLDRFIEDLPEGAFWPTGKWLKRVLRTIRQLTNLVPGKGIGIARGTHSTTIYLAGAAGVAGAASTDVFIPSLSPWLGEGEAPGNQGNRILIKPGTINNRTAGNKTVEILATDGMKVYVECQLAPNDPNPLVSFLYKTTTGEVPVDSTNPPTKVSLLLFELHFSEGVLALSETEQYVTRSQSLVRYVLGVACGELTYGFTFSGT